MIVLSNTTEQTLQPGQALLFDEVVTKSGCGTCHRKNTGSVKLSENGRTYDISFTGNIGGTAAAAPVQLALSFGTGAVLNETTMISVPAAVADRNNVSARTLTSVCCCDYDRVSVINTGANPVVVAPNSALVVLKV